MIQLNKILWIFWSPMKKLRRLSRNFEKKVQIAKESLSKILIVWFWLLNWFILIFQTFENFPSRFSDNSFMKGITLASKCLFGELTNPLIGHNKQTWQKTPKMQNQLNWAINIYEIHGLELYSHYANVFHAPTLGIFEYTLNGLWNRSAAKWFTVLRHKTIIFLPFENIYVDYFSGFDLCDCCDCWIAGNVRK